MTEIENMPPEDSTLPFSMKAEDSGAITGKLASIGSKNSVQGIPFVQQNGISLLICLIKMIFTNADIYNFIRHK